MRAIKDSGPYVVFLPATDPADRRFGDIPRTLALPHAVGVHVVRFDRQVWYNAAVRKEARAQIAGFGPEAVILVGFSKSGLGAISLFLEIPEHVSALVVFDAPVAHRSLPPWGAEAFYDQESWLADLPLSHCDRLKERLTCGKRLILISGANFHQDMAAFSRALTEAGVGHVFLPRPHLAHHWNSGWIEEGLPVALDSGQASAGTKPSGP